MLTEKDHESIKPGVSILVEETRNKGKDKHKHSVDYDENKFDRSAPSLRLKSLRTLLIYLLLFVAMTGVLLTLDGAPHLPEHIWSWQEIWDKLSGPSAGVPLDFIKYLTCSLGWFMLAYVAFTLVLEGLVDIFYLFSVKLGGGQPGKIAQGLKKVTTLLPASPTRRALDGLLLGAAFFAVVTTVAGGRGATSNNIATVTNNDQQGTSPEVAGLVFETSDGYQVDYGQDNTEVVESAFYKASFQPLVDDSFNSENPDIVISQPDLVAAVNNPTPVANFYGQETIEVKHKVEPGDSLWSLAQRYYGSGQLYTQIYQANLGQPMGGGSHFNASGVIQPGWILTIPNVSKAQVDNNWDMTASNSKQTQEQNKEIYIVQRGDSMRSIAQKLLGNEMRWPEIWRLNLNHPMKDGLIPSNPDLIYPGWELKLPAKTVETSQPPLQQPQPQPANTNQQPVTVPTNSPTGQEQQNGGNQNSGQPANNSTPTPTQQPSNSSTVSPVQTPAVTAPPATVTPAPIATPLPQVEPKQPIIQSAERQQENWLWPVLEGLGGLLALTGLGLGLRKVGGVLRKRWKSGELNGLRRSRWQTFRETNEWENENAPQTRALPVVQTDEWGQDVGFATTDRPLELLKLLANGFDADRPRLVLQALQSVFTSEGLPLLQPVNCIESRRRLAYQFTGSPQTVAIYLKAASEGEINSELSYDTSNDEFDEEGEGSEEEQGEMSSYKGKVIPFLSGLGRKKDEDESETLQEEQDVQGELVEAITRKLGGMALIEKQREGIMVILEGIEPRYGYSPIATGPQFFSIEDEKIFPEEADSVQYDKMPLASEYDSSSAENDLYQAYNEEEEEVFEEPFIAVAMRARASASLQEHSYAQLRQEFAQISHENGTTEIVSEYVENFEYEPGSLSPGYLFFGLGAVADKDEPFEFEAADFSQTENADEIKLGHSHYQLCLDTGGNLLFVASKGDEAAQAVLYSSVFQIATAAGTQDVAFYLVDRAVALTDEEIQTSGQEFGLSAEAHLTHEEELQQNREVFNALVELPQTVAVVAGDTRTYLDAQETVWVRNTVELLDLLLEELVRRRAEVARSDQLQNEEEQSAVKRLPRLVLVISDLAAVVAVDQNGTLLQLLTEGPAWEIYILAATNFETISLQSYAASQPLLSIINHFGSLGLFVTPDEKSSEQLLGGSPAAFELSGDGDMLFRSVNKQLTRLRGFRIEVKQLRQGVELLQALYKNLNPEEIIAQSPLEVVEDYEPSIKQEVESEDVIAEPEELKVEAEVTLSPVQNVPDALEVKEAEATRNLTTLLQNWRWRLLQNGLLQPAITIHALHGLTVHFGLLPTPKKSRTGKGHYFPFSPEPLASYQCLKEAGLDYRALLEANNTELETGKIVNAEKIDQLLNETIAQSEAKLSNNELAEQLLAQGFENQEIEEAFVALQKLLHDFCWLESDNLMPRIQNGDLALLSYLALHTGAQSSYTVGQAILKPTETDKQLLRNLEVRLTRTHKSLRSWVTACLQEIFGDQFEAKEELGRLVKVENLNFIEDDTKRETLKLNDKLIWVDVWELDRLLTEYKRTATTDTAERIKWLEEAYWLVQFTADIHNDEVEESRLKLLGVWGDHHAADWEDLAIMRQHVVQRWFDLNMTLGDHYTSLQSGNCNNEQKDIFMARAVEHYSQAALVQPTYPEPIKALIQLYHSKNDLSGLRTVFNDYCTNCKHDDQEPEEDVVELYNKAANLKRRRNNNVAAQQRKAI
ncbi:MAG TPA: LysM peptidoglycan-binding domain-containing protein [Chloroflexia bacterium]|nr:LysM peptidoglycan-binding domain-containing protein [Chloroflexia bacterium]